MAEIQKGILEGFTNQYIRALCNDIPQKIKEGCRIPEVNLDIEQQVSDVVKERLIKKTGEGEAVYELPGLPDYQTTDKLLKRKKYQVAQFIKEITEDYEKSLSGGKVMKPHSPFAEIMIMGKVREGHSRDEVVNSIYRGGPEGGIEGYLEKLKKPAQIRNGGLEQYVGFTDYEYFSLLATSDSKKAVKLIQIDIEECLYRLANTGKYRQFAEYAPESFSKGFYADGRGVTLLEDEEYKRVSEKYVQDTFFPDVINVAHAKIVSEDAWDYDDMAIFQYLTTKAIKESFNGGGVLRVEGKVVDVVKDALNKKRGGTTMKMAQKRLRKIFSTHFEAELNGQIIGKTVFDKFYIGYGDELKGEDDATDRGDSEVRYRADFGASITADIVSSRLNMSVRPVLEEMESKVSRILYTQLKRDRSIDQVLKGKNEHIYSLMDMMLMVRVRESQKAKRIGRYKEALNEMKEKEILIRDYYESGGFFHIQWYPLTDEENKDIRMLNG